MIGVTSPAKQSDKAVSGDLTQKKRARRARRNYLLRRTHAVAHGLPGRLFPQWLRTLLVTLVWFAFMPVYIQLISPYATMLSARSMGVGLALFAGLAPHLWPTKTSPWRTPAWALVLSIFVGMTLLILGAGRWALLAATIVGFGIVLLRINQNGRKVWNLFRTWRYLR